MLRAIGHTQLLLSVVLRRVRDNDTGIRSTSKGTIAVI